jgi:hypothetical protein
MQTASGGGRERAPRSLKERLALLECGVRPVAAARVRAGTRHKTARTAAQRRRTLLGTSFWIGLGCGSALGSAMLLLAFLTHPGEMQTRLREVQAAADAMARPSLPASRQVRTYSTAGAPTQAAFAMSIHRGDGGAASVGLRVLGIDSPDSVQVLLRDVPATAELSRGQRRDPGTWALRVAELENLQLTLGDGTPDAFDMIIEVASSGGTRMAKAVAHVRVSDPRGVAQMSAPPARALAAGVEGFRRSAMPVLSGSADPGSAASGSSVIERPFRTEVTALARAEPPPEQLSAPRPALPGGISSLGGPLGEPGAPAQPQETRTVWWKLPPPTWTPFADGTGSH